VQSQSPGGIRAGRIFAIADDRTFGIGQMHPDLIAPTPWGQKTRTSHLLLYSQQLQAGIAGNLGRRQSPQISPSQDRFPTIGASAQLTHGGIS